MVQKILSLCMFFIQCFIGGFALISIILEGQNLPNTPDYEESIFTCLDDYGFNASNAQYIAFKVNTCSKYLRLKFMETLLNDKASFTVWIPGEPNSITKIVEWIPNSTLENVSALSGSLLDCHNFQTFLITWNTYAVSLRKCQLERFEHVVKVLPSAPYDVKYVCVVSDKSAEWTVYDKEQVECGEHTTTDVLDSPSASPASTWNTENIPETTDKTLNGEQTTIKDLENDSVTTTSAEKHIHTTLTQERYRTTKSNLNGSESGGYISLITSKQNVSESDFTFTLLSDYGYSVGDSTSITLEVKACLNAYIGLMEVNDINEALFSIAIGGWNNGKSVIYPSKSGGGILTEYNGQLLSCSTYRTFEVNWSNKTIQLWTYVDSTWTKVLSYSTYETNRIHYLGVSTSIWATGHWRIFSPDQGATTATMTKEQATTQAVVVADIFLTTPKQSVRESDFTFTLLSDYGYSVGDSTSITLEVKACKDAYIGLMELNDKNEALFNIKIGGWHNQKTIMYPQKLGGSVLTEYNGQLLNCSTYQTFEVNWGNETIELWTYVKSTWMKVLSYSTNETNRIHYLGVSTSIWATGHWRIFTSGTNPSSAPHTDTCCNHVCYTNISMEQLKEEIKLIREALTVNKKDTTLHLNKLRSADDKRMSAAGIGYVGVAIIAGGLVGIVLVDLPNLVHMFKTMYHNITQ